MVMEQVLPVSQKLEADIYFYSGDLTRAASFDFVDMVSNSQRNNNCLLMLTTVGGDPDAAYVIARCLQSRYEKFDVYVPGYCKSAGTMLTIGADEIIMSEHGELGPLDVQMRKEDNIDAWHSGLDVLQALGIIGEQAFQVFETHMLEIISRSSGSITTKTAADIAASVATGLLSPITQQIDPRGLGETMRAMNVARQYGRRLGERSGASDDCINALTSGYPSHSFVIDFEEARGLFPHVRACEEDEYALEAVLMEHLGRRVLMISADSPIMFSLLDVIDAFPGTDEDEDEDGDEHDEIHQDDEVQAQEPGDDERVHQESGPAHDEGGPAGHPEDQARESRGNAGIPQGEEPRCEEDNGTSAREQWVSG